jgi:hypothetical protein
VFRRGASWPAGYPKGCGFEFHEVKLERVFVAEYLSLPIRKEGSSVIFLSFAGFALPSTSHKEIMYSECT